MTEEVARYIGLDVHKASISVSVAEEGRNGEVRFIGALPNTSLDVAKLTRRLSKEGHRLEFCYEAGGCGYGLYRQLIELGHRCTVVAPSLIPSRPGDRIKTDRRDSQRLAILHRSGDLGATITGPQQDLNLGIATYLNGVLTSPIEVDTSQPATDTIDYVATDQSGLAATSTRTVIIQTLPSAQQVPTTTATSTP